MPDEEIRAQWDQELWCTDEEPTEGEAESSLQYIEASVAKLENLLTQETIKVATHQVQGALDSVSDSDTTSSEDEFLLQGNGPPVTQHQTSTTIAAVEANPRKCPSGYSMVGDTGFGGASVVGSNILEQVFTDFTRPGAGLPEVSGFRLRFSTYRDRHKRTRSDKNYLLPALCGSQRLIIPVSGNKAHPDADWPIGVALGDQIGLEKRQGPEFASSYMVGINDATSQKFWRNSKNQYRYNFATALMNSDAELRSLQRYQAEYGVAGGLFAWSSVKRVPEKLVMLFRVVGDIDPTKGSQDRYGTEMWEDPNSQNDPGNRMIFQVSATTSIYEPLKEAPAKVYPAERGLPLEGEDPDSDTPSLGTSNSSQSAQATTTANPILPDVPADIPDPAAAGSGRPPPQANKDQLQEDYITTMEKIQTELADMGDRAEERVKLGHGATVEEIQEAVKDIGFPKTDAVGKSTGTTKRITLTRSEVLQLSDAIMQMARALGWPRDKSQVAGDVIWQQADYRPILVKAIATRMMEKRLPHAMRQRFAIHGPVGGSLFVFTKFGAAMLDSTFLQASTPLQGGD